MTYKYMSADAPTAFPASSPLAETVYLNTDKTRFKLLRAPSMVELTAGIEEYSAKRAALLWSELAQVTDNRCGFAKSALVQNPRIKTALGALEDGLRKRGILPPLVERDPEAPTAPLMRDPGVLRAAAEAERLRRLEQENAALKAEVAELKRTIERFAVLREALALTGRLPR